jgi:hypothetical protein
MRFITYNIVFVMNLEHWGRCVEIIISRWSWAQFIWLLSEIISYWSLIWKINWHVVFLNVHTFVVLSRIDLYMIVNTLRAIILIMMIIEVRNIFFCVVIRRFTIFIFLKQMLLACIHNIDGIHWVFITKCSCDMYLLICWFHEVIILVESWNALNLALWELLRS